MAATQQVVFKYNETETVRVPKLNETARQAFIGAGAFGVDLDGGDASGVTSPMMDCDGGGA